MDDIIFLVNRENFKVLLYWYYFWCKCGQREIVKCMEWKTCFVCVIYIKCVEVLHFCRGMING